MTGWLWALLTHVVTGLRSMTAGEWSFFIAMMVHALVLWVYLRRIGVDMHKVEKETNSMRATLEKAEHALGKVEGRAEVEAERAAERIAS